MKHAILISLLSLTGCTVAARIEHDVVDFNRAVEATSNEIAFLNVLRSYKRMPRHYTSISTLQGNLKVVAAADVSSTINPGRVATNVVGTSDVSAASNTSTGGVTTVTDATTTTNNASSTLATARDTYVPKLSGSVTSNPNYSVGVLESQEFYRGLLMPIDINTIALYASQGWNSELLWNIFIEGIWFEFPNGNRRYLDNDPSDPNWLALAEQSDLIPKSEASPAKLIADRIALTDVGIAKLYEAGLTVQSCGASDSALISCNPDNQYYVASSPRTAVTLTSTLSGAPDEYQCSDAEKQPNYDLSDPNIAGDDVLVRVFLQNTLSFGEPSAVEQLYPSAAGTQCSGEAVKAALVTRSTDGVIYYVGEYLRAVGTVNCKLPGTTSEILIGSDPMIRICQSFSGPTSINAAIGGEEWAIPADTASVTSRSMQLLGLVQQLVNLNKVSEDLPKPTFIQVN